MEKGPKRKGAEIYFLCKTQNFKKNLRNSSPGLANCRYVAHQSARQGKNAPKGYIAREKMTPKIAHIHIGKVHNGMQ